MTKSNPQYGLFFVLIALSSIGTLALNIYIPAMPELAASLSVSPAMIQYSLSFYLLALAVAQLLIGPLSDKYGRRIVMLVAQIIFIVSSLAASLSPNIETLIFARMFQAAGGVAGIVLSRAIIRDVYEPKDSASMLGYLAAIVTIAPMVAPIIGGYLTQTFNWQSTFIFVAAYALLIFLIALKFLPETNFTRAKSLNIKNMPKHFMILLRKKEFLGYALNIGFNNAIFFSFLAGSPFIMSEYFKLSATEYGFYFVIVALTYAFGNFLSARLAKIVRIRYMMIAGNLTTMLGILAINITFAQGFTNPLELFVPMGIVAISAGMIMPSAMAKIIHVKPKLAGSASGLSGFMQLLCGAAGSYLVGQFHMENGGSAILFMTMFGILSFIAYFFLIFLPMIKQTEAVHEA